MFGLLVLLHSLHSPLNRLLQEQLFIASVEYFIHVLLLLFRVHYLIDSFVPQYRGGLADQVTFERFILRVRIDNDHIVVFFVIIRRLGVGAVFIWLNFSIIGIDRAFKPAADLAEQALRPGLFFRIILLQFFLFFRFV